jgi:hypothetical protein
MEVNELRPRYDSLPATPAMPVRRAIYPKGLHTIGCRIWVARPEQRRA